MYKKEMSYCSQTFHGTCNNVSIANTTTIYNYTTNTSDGSRRNIDQSQGKFGFIVRKRMKSFLFRTLITR